MCDLSRGEWNARYRADSRNNESPGAAIALSLGLRNNLDGRHGRHERRGNARIGNCAYRGNKLREMGWCRLINLYVCSEGNETGKPALHATPWAICGLSKIVMGWGRFAAQNTSFSVLYDTAPIIGRWSAGVHGFGRKSDFKRFCQI